MISARPGQHHLFAHHTLISTVALQGAAVERRTLGLLHKVLTIHASADTASDEPSTAPPVHALTLVIIPVGRTTRETAPILLFVWRSNSPHCA